jgi:tetratricopeptide (TPR) repeat protein
MTLLFYGYLGAYVFSVQELVRRYNTFDLRPQVYSSILVRMLIAAVITFVGASVISAGGGQLASRASGTRAEPQAWAAVLAFMIGVFPSSGLRWFSQQIKPLLGSATDQTTELPLRNILGVSSWHESRLAEMGIDDAQNLATADIRKLLLTTQFDTQQIVHWIDQAILYVKAGSRIDRFRDARITTFHELRLVLNELSAGPAANNDDRQAAKTERQESRKRLAAVLGMSGEDELTRLSDYSSFPNYSYIVEYYSRTARVARQRATAGMETLIGALEETDFERAVKDGQRLLFHNPEDAKLWTNLGTAYYRLGQYDKAHGAYTRALALDGELVQAYYSRSMIYISQGEYKKAIQDCTNAINVDRSHAKAFNNRGLAYMHLGYLDRAVDDLDEALRLNERLAVAYNNRGLVHNTQGDFEPAVRDFERAYLLGFAEVGLRLGWGIALIGLERYQEAIQQLSQAVLYETELGRAYAKRGYAYLELGETFYSQARNDLETAIGMDGKLADAHHNLGLLEARLENYPAAISHYQAALDLDPGQFVTRYNLALAYYRLGRLDDARAHFGTLSETAPRDSVEAEQAQMWLTRLTVSEEPPIADEENATQGEE